MFANPQQGEKTGREPISDKRATGKFDLGEGISEVVIGP